MEELVERIDMAELKQFNPKLHAQIEKDPNLLLDLQDTIMAHEEHAAAAAMAEAATAAVE